MSHVEVDGVPTLVAPTVGPARAGLVFRVGQADETLARRGITHLTEHLVLHPIGGSTYHHNGSTGQTTTTFYVQGGDDDIVDFFARVCRSLAEPGIGRLAMERDVLRTEETGRGSGPARDLPLWRHGACGYGLLSYPEWGLNALTADDVLAWIATHFTRENAALWIAGDGVPDGLRLDLPPGRRQPLPAVTSALPATPAFFNGGGPATAIHAVVPESPAGIVYAHLLQRRMYRALRLDTGLSYTTAVEYVERGDGQATITAYADALVDKQDAVLGGFVDVLAGLRAAPVAGTELAAAVATAALEAGGTDATAQGLPGQAFRLLTGRTLVDVDAQVAALRAVTAEDVRTAARQAHASALLMTPPGGAEWAGYAPAPTTSRTRAGGRGHVPAGGGGPVIHLDADAISAVDPDGDAATVRYDECAVVLAHPDGSRLLIGHDGIVVAVDLDRYPDLTAAQIDRVPAGLLVSLPGAAPPPAPAVRARSVGRLASFLRPLTPAWLRLGALGLVTAVVGGAALAYTLAMVFGLLDQVRLLSVIGGWLIAGWFGRAFLRAWTARRARA